MRLNAQWTDQSREHIRSIKGKLRKELLKKYDQLLFELELSTHHHPKKMGLP